MGRSESKSVGRGGLMRTVTVTVELANGEPFSFLAGNQKLAAERLIAMSELPKRLLSVSTPDTIYGDLGGDPKPPQIDPLLMASFQEPPIPSSFAHEYERARLRKMQRQVAAMRGEDE